MSSVFVKTSENLKFSVKKVTLSSYFPPNYSDISWYNLHLLVPVHDSIFFLFEVHNLSINKTNYMHQKQCCSQSTVS